MKPFRTVPPCTVTCGFVRGANGKPLTCGESSYTDPYMAPRTVRLDDVLTTGKGGATEAAYGGRGDDVLKDFASGQSPGLLVGGPGRDRCIGDKLDTFRGCEVVKIRPHWE